MCGAGRDKGTVVGSNKRVTSRYKVYETGGPLVLGVHLGRTTVRSCAVEGQVVCETGSWEVRRD